jgi:ATP-binding cassette subfamily A (ABC1) protein 3
MLTGLYPATDGDADIFGSDLRSELSTIRSFMGVCPQHDVLFELLTPEEHLDIFYEFKGGDNAKKHDEIERLLKDVGVADKRTTKSVQLSGGNKRKLSVAIALCGGSKFVLLDEPSSGLDLSARRELWNMLRKYKKERVILLTTHYMDEADILGDRIGIMSAGKMTCLGSSMFLKNKFGVGYHVSFEKEQNEPNNEVVPYFEKNLGQGVKKFTEVAGELSITVPPEYSGKFDNFFSQLDNDLGKLNVRSYGVQISTLEQVFLQIGHLENPEEILDMPDPAMQSAQRSIIQPKANFIDNEKVEVYNLEKSEKDVSFISNLKAVLIKRANIYKRNRRSFLFETLIPSLIILCGVAISKYSDQWKRSPVKDVSPDLYPLKQKLLVNKTPIDYLRSDLTPEKLIANLPQNVFDVTYDENVYKSYDEFSKAIYDFGSIYASE